MKILIVSPDGQMFADIQKQLIEHGFEHTSVITKNGSLKRGHVEVDFAGSYDTGRKSIENFKPDQLIANWRLDGMYRHNTGENQHGGVSLATYAFKEHGCQRVICMDKTHPYFSGSMSKAILDLLGEQAEAYGEYILPHVPHSSSADADALVRYILHLPNQAHRPVYGPPAPARVATPE